MDFEKKYPLSQLKGEFVRVQWTRGYKQVDVYYKDALIAEVSGAGELMRGVTILTEQLGELKLKLSQSPVMLDVIVDGLHSPANVSHPVKELKKTATYFWIISAFAIIAGAFEIAIFRDQLAFLPYVLTINLVVFITYAASGFLVRKGIPFGFYLGFGMFSFVTFIFLLLLIDGFIWGLFFYIFQAIRLGGVVALATNMKTAIQASKHRKYKEATSDELLDSKL